MASVERHDLPAYCLEELPSRARHLLLTPAVRWRVVVEDVQKLENDVILDTVLELRSAGEHSPSRIADLLQLPEDLVRSLLAQAAARGIRLTSDGQIQSRASSVAWVYRDLATGELWPDPAAEAPPLALRFTTRYRAQFVRGTAGRPIHVDCLLLDTSESVAAEPTNLELTRFSRASNDRTRRTAIVSQGERCLVASPVARLTTGFAVETTRGVPHLSLSQHLAKANGKSESVARWLGGITARVAPSGTDLPLRRAVSELLEVVSDSPSTQAMPDWPIVLSRVELCLSRFVDQYRYQYDLFEDPEPMTSAALILHEVFGLQREAADTLSHAERGTASNKVARLLVAAPQADAILRKAAGTTAQLAVLAQEPTSSRDLVQLVEATTALCELLLTASEGPDVQQAG